MQNKKGTIIITLLGLFFIGGYIVVTKCYERVDAGYAGIRVNLYGSNRGVDDVAEVTGAVWFNPITTEIHEFPLFVQNSIFTRDNTEGSRNNDEIRVTTNDGVVITMDISINYRINPESSVQIFKKYRKPLAEISNTVLRNYLRDAYNRSASDYSAEEIYQKKNDFITKAEQLFSTELSDEGFIVEKVDLLNELRLPQNILDAIKAKSVARQIAEQKKNELAQEKADAEKRIENARGEAEALKIKADAQKYAYEQKQKALTKLIIQQQLIEKWDGKLPVYGEVPNLFRDVTK